MGPGTWQLHFPIRYWEVQPKALDPEDCDVTGAGTTIKISGLSQAGHISLTASVGRLSILASSATEAGEAGQEIDRVLLPCLHGGPELVSGP